MQKRLKLWIDDTAQINIYSQHLSNLCHFDKLLSSRYYTINKPLKCFFKKWKAYKIIAIRYIHSFSILQLECRTILGFM